MKGFYAIYRKEMGHYFVSPVAYVVVGVFLFLSAYFFNNVLIRLYQQAIEIELQASQFGPPPPIDVTMSATREWFGVVATLLLFLTPLLSMGVYSEERKLGTMELLLTSPLTETQIVLGKFFASMTLFAIMLLPTVFAFVFMYSHSEPAAPWKVLPVAYLGVLLLGGVLLSLGSFFSSLTESQLIAAILSFGAILVIWVADFSSPGQSGAVAALTQYCSFYHHYDDFTRGVLDSSDVIFYLSFVVLAVFLTIRSLDSIRWRRA